MRSLQIQRDSKKPMVILIILSCISRSAFAQDLPSSLDFARDANLSKMGRGSEYTSGDYPGAVLMRVNLWGAVGKPGIHFVPSQTDLITLLSFAGGPTEGAKISDLYIKRWTAGKETVLKVNGEDLLKEAGMTSPILRANDIVVVPKAKPLISQDTLTVVTLVSSVLSIFALGFLVFRPK